MIRDALFGEGIRISRERLECGASPRFLALPNTCGSWLQYMRKSETTLPTNLLSLPRIPCIPR